MKEGAPTLERRENYDSAIILRIFRHGDKEGLKDPLSKIDQERLDSGLISDKDYLLKLKKEGRSPAHTAGDETDIEQSIAYGSPRERSQETAARVMVGPKSELNQEHDFHEIKDKLNEDLEFGSKIGMDERLNFNSTGPVGEGINRAYEKGETLKFVAEESDNLAKETGDDKSSTYSRMAGNVAELVNRYVKASDRWNELVEDKDGGYEKELKRFLGTHQTVTESFLAKIVEKTKGSEARARLLEVIGGNGFGFVEGIKVTIENRRGEKKIFVEYSKDLPNNEKYDFREEVSPEIIEEIIKEGKE